MEKLLRWRKKRTKPSFKTVSNNNTLHSSPNTYRITSEELLASVMITILHFLGMEERNSQLERVYGLWVQSQEIKAGRILVLDSLSLDCYLNSAPILYNFEIWKTSFQYLYEGFIVE